MSLLYPTKRMMPSSWCALFSAGVVWLLLLGCDTTVTLFRPEVQYSVFGYIDADRDTHVFRITELKDSVPRGVAPGRIDSLTVRLRDTRTGEVDPLTVTIDTLDRETVSNARLNLRSELGTSYELEIDGVSGPATIPLTMPSAPPEIEVDTFRACGDSIGLLPVRASARGEDKLSQVSARIFISFTGNGASINGPFVEDMYATLLNAGDGDDQSVDGTYDRIGSDIVAFVQPFVRNPERVTPFAPDSVQVIVSSAGPEWPGSEFLTSPFVLISTPQRLPGAEGALGIVFGSVTDTVSVPYVRCGALVN